MCSIGSIMRAAFGLRKKDLVEPSSFTHFWGLVVCAEEMGEPSKMQEFDDSLLIDSEWIQFVRPIFQVLKEDRPEARLWDSNYQKFLEELSCVRAHSVQ